MTRNSGRGRGSGGGGGGRNRQPLTREVKISKSLAYLLRHQAKNEGVAMDEGGWANVRDVVSIFVTVICSLLAVEGVIRSCFDFFEQNFIQESYPIV